MNSVKCVKESADEIMETFTITKLKDILYTTNDYEEASEITDIFVRLYDLRGCKNVQLSGELNGKDINVIIDVDDFGYEIQKHMNI